MNWNTVIVEEPAMDLSDCGVDNELIHLFLGGSSIEDRNTVMEAFDDAQIAFQEDNTHSNQKINELKFPMGVQLCGDVLQSNNGTCNRELKTEAIPLSVSIDNLGTVGTRQCVDVGGQQQERSIWVKHFAGHLFWHVANKSQGSIQSEEVQRTDGNCQTAAVAAMRARMNEE